MTDAIIPPGREQIRAWLLATRANVDAQAAAIERLRLQARAFQEGVVAIARQYQSGELRSATVAELVAGIIETADKVSR